MMLNTTQLEHLASLAVADAVHEKDRRTRREWQWKPHLAGPLIRSSVLFALQKRKLARWFPTVTDDLPYPGGRMKITADGRRFLTTVLHGN
jgi:hypothetical protein